MTEDAQPVADDRPDGDDQPPLFGTSDIGFHSMAPEPSRADMVQQLSGQLAEIAQLMRHSVQVGAQQLAVMQRIESRQLQAQKNQQDDFQHWLETHPDMAENCLNSHETLRRVLGTAITDLSRYIEEHDDDLAHNDFLRAEMVDRFGASFHHLASMYAMMKRVATVEKARHRSTPEDAAG